jgi:hypothetical protein
MGHTIGLDTRADRSLFPAAHPWRLHQVDHGHPPVTSSCPTFAALALLPLLVLQWLASRPPAKSDVLRLLPRPMPVAE